MVAKNARVMLGMAPYRQFGGEKTIKLSVHAPCLTGTVMGRVYTFQAERGSRERAIRGARGLEGPRLGRRGAGAKDGDGQSGKTGSERTVCTISQHVRVGTSVQCAIDSRQEIEYERG
jgi:hypothetical protein